MPRVPSHVAIIMDGNGRWASQKGLPRLQGHKAGVDAATAIVRHCGELGIPYLTLFAFSSENWNRPFQEISGLMRILSNYLTKGADELIENGVRIKLIGNLARLPQALQKALRSICNRTALGSKLTLTLAISYGSRSEIVEATKSLAQDVSLGNLSIEDLTESLFEQRLETFGVPDPDLLIRTSGEMRISNFLLWQLSYAELYMTPVLWPDFTQKDFDLALQDYAKRHRRFGRSS
ncbi:MAG: isoprenyl transferase [Myxococcaceae bacterium]|nr:isoprenyl transferase [Myxococcaceae bacterium]MBH2006282.1 isoprenyl transferase [Myxococcaceae bacterium]